MISDAGGGLDYPVNQLTYSLKVTSSLKLVPVIGLDEMSVVIHVLWDNGLWNIRTIKRRNDHDLYWYGCSQEDHHFLCT